MSNHNEDIKSKSDNVLPITPAVPKPGGFSFEKFKSKRSPSIAGVETLQTALPVQRLSEARDFVRLHKDEEAYWSPELCFVNVPIKGQKRDTLHIIEDDLAAEFVPAASVKRFRLALATKPYDTFFLCIVPTQNTDNSWVASNLAACEMAKSHWVITSSRRDEGVDSYKVDLAKDADAFPEPRWPTQNLLGLVEVAFAGRMIDCEDHPALLRLIGARQSAS
jgi:hypothetical protein